ncbi:hypothetical protein EJ05DRAFT_502163 [Pseudovirgaria hyperparasitica]|uniref:Uncharacterized protein n=1 Tax=Pseudovirgaria hyperparasitica TaxID=470096 RepID=A0A6A6W176_9PEZI|nr:uncharacterized protein EJ05DRAFT_502163 [Pseudovirgaria hyperparasitica]KAF2756668.1 hypothetical protein EJ05DRAFT_502163 [Pseudovirgaria hyperparasitica]
MTRLFPPTWKGLHPIAPDLPEPYSPRELDVILQCGLLWATVSMPFRYGIRRFIRKQRMPLPGSFLAHLVYGSAASWALNALCDQREKSCVIPFFEKHGIEQKPFRIIERTGKIGMDDIVVLGASAGLLVARTRLKPTITGWRRHIGLAFAGATTMSILADYPHHMWTESAWVSGQDPYTPSAAFYRRFKQERQQAIVYTQHRGEIAQCVPESTISMSQMLRMHRIFEEHASIPSGTGLIEIFFAYYFLPMKLLHFFLQPFDPPGPDDLLEIDEETQLGTAAELPRYIPGAVPWATAHVPAVNLEVKRDYLWSMRLPEDIEYMKHELDQMEVVRHGLFRDNAYIMSKIAQKEYELYTTKDQGTAEHTILIFQLDVLAGFHRKIESEILRLGWRMREAQRLLALSRGENITPKERLYYTENSMILVLNRHKGPEFPWPTASDEVAKTAFAALRQELEADFKSSD